MRLMEEEMLYLTQMSIECEYCGKTISNKSNLKTHQRTKTCQDIYSSKEGIIIKKLSYVELEAEVNILRSMKEKYEDLSIKYGELTRDYHQMEIKYTEFRSKNEIYQSLYGEIKQQQLDDNKETRLILTQLASKPTISNTQNNNVIFNNMKPLNLSEQRIINAIANYTMAHYMKGAEGMIEWIVPNLLTDDSDNLMYRCNDKNRGHYFYKAEDGSKVEDVHGQKLIQFVTPHMLPKLKEYKRIRNEEIMKQYGDDDENYQGSENLISRKQRENRELHDAALGKDLYKKLVTKLI